MSHLSSSLTLATLTPEMALQPSVGCSGGSMAGGTRVVVGSGSSAGCCRKSSRRCSRSRGKNGSKNLSIKITCSSSSNGSSRGEDVPADSTWPKLPGRRSVLLALASGLAAWNLAETLSPTQSPDAPSNGRRGAAAAADGDRPREEYDDLKLLKQNRRIQELNSAPENFPGFIREGFNVKVVTGPEYVTSPSGLIYWDIKEGEGELPKDGEQVTFHYTGFNESGRRVDSTYLQGRPAKTRVGISGLIPGFEEGIVSMKAGGIRRIIIPPELGPPTGPSTFFSAKQFEVFDVELLSIKECTRRQVIFYSDVVCE